MSKYWPAISKGRNSIFTGRDEEEWESSAIGRAVESLGLDLEMQQNDLGELALAAIYSLRCAGEHWSAGADLVAIWEYGRAQEFVGMAKAFAAADDHARERLKAEALSQIAKKGADARHQENRAMKDQVVEHYLAHRSTYASKDAAAEHMSRTLVPLKFRTVRDWLIGLPPAGKA